MRNDGGVAFAAAAAARLAEVSPLGAEPPEEPLVREFGVPQPELARLAVGVAAALLLSVGREGASEREELFVRERGGKRADCSASVPSRGLLLGTENAAAAATAAAV